jgi:membrane-bound serine protease (ClpP class)
MRFKTLLSLFIILSLALPTLSFGGGLMAEQASSEPLPLRVATVASETEKPADEEISWHLVVFGLMLGGLILLFFEIAIIPGFGITGISGLLMILAAMIMAYLKLSVIVGTLVMLFGIGAVIFLIYWFTTIFPTTAMGKKFVLNTDDNAENSSIAVDDFEHLVGAEGETLTALKPAGKARINDERYDVITEGEFIDKGSTVVVKKSTAGRIIVALVEQPFL